MQKSRLLKIDCVNRIKLEKVNEFNKSIFHDVYEKAITLTSKIINDTIRIKSEINNNNSSYLDGERLNNIIPFLGERGMGKSSAMLSFANYLENYEEEKNDDYSLSIEKKCSKPSFLVLPQIDIAMLVKGENLLDIILANMWTSFYKKMEKEKHFCYEQEQTKKRFESVKRSYELFTGNETRGISSVRELKELSKCLNLKNDFKELVDSYLYYMMKENEYCNTNNFLLITLDDLDVATQGAYNVLEHIRLFLMIPNVIVLVSADMERLFIECNKYFADTLLNTNVINDQDKDLIRSYSEKYLAKIFPDNMRIFMPNINIEENAFYEIVIPGMENEIKRDASIQDVFNLLIYKYTGIMLYHNTRMNYVLHKSSLRVIVNNLYILSELFNQDREKQFEEVYEWIKTNLNDFCNRVTNYRKHRALVELLEVGDSNVGETIIQVFPLLFGENRYDRESDWKREEEYGYIIKYLADERMAENRELVDFVLLLYSNHIARFINKKGFQTKFEDIYGKSVFDNILKKDYIDEFRLYDPLESDTSEQERENMSFPSTLFEISLKWNEENNIIKCFADNALEIYRVICLSILCNIELAECNKKEYVSYCEDTTNTKKIDKKLLFLSRKDFFTVSIDSFMRNILRYDVIVEGVCKNIYNAVVGTSEENVKKNYSINKIIGITQYNMKEYSEWKKRNKLNSLVDVLPLESVESILRIAERIKQTPLLTAKKVGTSYVSVRNLSRQIDVLINELEIIQNYYKLDKKNRYSDKIMDFLHKFHTIEIVKEFTEQMEMHQELSFEKVFNSPN